MSAVARRDSADFSDSQDVERNSTNDEPESDYDSAGSESEHSDQDQESQETERRVDDDEDRSNPQYIPKRGTFYEHDDRTAASGEEPASTQSETSSEKKEGSPPPERRRPPRKSEVIDRWAHDKYNENEQAPKSRDELVAIYGYDIRNEDAPPHARRNRRYGRGPNKYTRTWEDEEAYRRQAAAQPRKPPNPEDFPDLEQANNKHRRPRGPRPRSRSQPTSNESLSNGTALRRHASIKAKPTAKPAPKPATPPQAKTTPKQNKEIKEKLPQIENLTITATVNNSQSQPQRKVNAVAQQRPVPTEQGRKKPAPPQQPAAPAPPAAAPAPAQQPAGAEPRGSKRYSSLRQRPLAETYSPQQQQTQQQQQQQQQQQPQPQMRYHPEYAGNPPPPVSQHQGSPAPQMHPQQLIHPQQVQQQQAAQAAAAAQRAAQAPRAPAPQQQHSQQVRLGMVEQQQMLPHPHHALHNLPPQPHNMAPAPLQQAQGYAPPAMMPAQYMQQGGNTAVFGGAPLYAQPPPQPYQHPHPLYPHHNYATTAGGVTYYSPAEQEPVPAPAPRPARRPTAAIPIVRPDRPANSSEKDNIDRIVENMFVRKPWPGTQPNSDGTKESESRNSQEPQSKESSQPNSLTSSSISTDSKQEKERTEPEAKEEDKKPETKEEVTTESIADA